MITGIQRRGQGANHAGPLDEGLALIKGERYIRRRRIPPNEQSSVWCSSGGSSDCAIEVITFEMGFTPSGFDRPVTEYFKYEIRSKLAITGVVTLTVIFKRGPRGERILHFDGPDEDLAKAALNMNRRTQIDSLP